MFAGEGNRPLILEWVRLYLKPFQKKISILIDVIGPPIVTPEEVKDCLFGAEKYIPLNQFGRTDNCG